MKQYTVKWVFPLYYFFGKGIYTSPDRDSAQIVADGLIEDAQRTPGSYIQLEID